MCEIIERRREQLVFRLAMMTIIVVFFPHHDMAIWCISYILLQLLEIFTLSRERLRSFKLSAPYGAALLFAHSAVFGLPSIVWAQQGGTLGLMNGAYLLSGAILNSVMTTRNCKTAFIASISPFLIYIAAGALIAAGSRPDVEVIVTVGISGGMVGLCAVKLWLDASRTRRSELAAHKSILKAKAELDRALDAAEAANRAKSRFLANMSHEIRTPLNGVVALADMLSRADLDPKAREMAEIIHQSSDTLQRLLSDILDMARIESGAVAIEIAPFHLGDMVRSVAALFSPTCSQKGLSLVVEVAPDRETMVLGDPTRVRQIVTNLVSNAIKFTAAGEVRIGVDAVADAMTRLTVSDTGVGFAMADKAKVLGRFQQADTSITRRFGGTGLGLSICRDLVALMGGSLDCDSRPGEGARFWAILALEIAETGDGADAPADRADEEVEADALDALRILLADDHPTNRRIVQLMLAGAGVDLVCVEDGAEAIAAFKTQRFDVVLMDMQMPIVDGLTAVQEIRRLEVAAAWTPTPVIMLSANTQPEHVEAAIVAGADRHLAKPFTIGSLFDAIATLQTEAEEGAATVAQAPPAPPMILLSAASA